MSASTLFRASHWLSNRAPFFLDLLVWVLAAVAFCLIPDVFAADDVSTTAVVNSDFSSAREALIESIEAEGLVVSAIIPFNSMLARTASALGKAGSPFAEAEIVQFCSARLARQLVEEDAAQIALCPLSIAVYSTQKIPGQITFAYRSPGRRSAGLVAASDLLERLLGRAVGLARLR